MKLKFGLMSLCCLGLLFSSLSSCKQVTKKENSELIQSYVPKNAVIAHRGSPYWTPESTEAAYRWARNVGSDYLEGDLQVTSDGVIVITHDGNIYSKSDAHQKFPEKNRRTAEEPVYHVKDFTLKELQTLDLGSWFNEHPGRKAQARAGFVNQKILSLKDFIKIAEGYRIERDDDGAVIAYVEDEKDNGNRPGIYLETKEPALNPGIEKLLFEELNECGWNILEQPAIEKEFYKDGKVNVGNTNGKLVLQSFSRKSLELLKEITEGKIPTCYLLWYDPNDESGDSLRELDESTYDEYIEIARNLGVQFLGPSIHVRIVEGDVHGKEYEDLLTPWMAEKNRKAKFLVHPYTFDERVEAMENYYERCEGMFTNLANLSAEFYVNKKLRDAALINPKSTEDILDELGYSK